MKYQPRYTGGWALVIGINAYRYTSPLEIARADAETIHDVLIRDFKFPKKNICTLFDTQATRARIMEKFLSYESLGPDDRLLVFFAGHGSTVSSSRGSVGYLVPVDGKLKDKSSLNSMGRLNAERRHHSSETHPVCYGRVLQRFGYSTHFFCGRASVRHRHDAKIVEASHHSG